MKANDPSAGRTPETRIRRASRLLWVLVAALLLNGLLSAEILWPTPGLKPDHRLAPEFVLLWVVLLVAYRRAGRIGPRMIATLSGAYLLVFVGRYLDVAAPALFGRPVNLYWDGPRAARFLWVTAGQTPGWALALACVALALLGWLAFVGVRAAIARLASDAVPAAARSRVGMGISAIAVLLVAANLAGVRATWPIVSKPVTPTWLHQLAFVAAASSPLELAHALPASPRFDADLAELHGADVKLFFLESYGVVAFDDPRVGGSLDRSRQALADAIRRGGRQVVSARVRSPTFAGGSDLAHLGLLSGMDLSDPWRHDLLLTSRRPTMITLFAGHGYQTIGLYPALSWDWPEGRFYGYDLLLDARDLDWRGPKFGYWSLPDQFSLERFDQLQPVRPDSPPRLLFFATINSHLPFEPVPPVQPDRDRLLGATPYDPAAVARALAHRPNWTNLFPDYIRSIDYTYRWLADYLGRRPPRPDVIVLLGDHQPAASVTGPGASWDVPVHVLSSDPRLLERLLAHGFRPGLDPGPKTAGAMHQLTGWLLDAFSSPRAGIAHAGG